MGRRVRLSIATLRVRGYAEVRQVGDEFVGTLTRGDDYHEFTRQSLMEAAHAVRDFCRKNDVRISEIVVSSNDGAAVAVQAGE